MKKLLFASAVLMSLFSSAPSYAFESTDLNWFAGLGYEFGGQRYSGGTYVGSGISENAYANEGWRVMFGASVPNNAAKTFETQFSLGYKFGGPNGERSGIIWNTLPVEVVEYYRQGHWRTGVGLVYHVDTHVDFQSVNQPTESFRVNNGLGYVASMVYTPVAHNYAMELRYTYLKQAFADSPDDKLKASVFGAFLHYRF